MIDSAQLTRLMVQTKTLQLTINQHDPNDLLKLARAIYNTAIQDTALMFESDHSGAVMDAKDAANKVRGMK